MITSSATLVPLAYSLSRHPRIELGTSPFFCMVLAYCEAHEKFSTKLLERLAPTTWFEKELSSPIDEDNDFLSLVFLYRRTFGVTLLSCIPNKNSGQGFFVVLVN